MRYVSREIQRQISHLLERAVRGLPEEVQDRVFVGMSEALEENNGSPANAFDRKSGVTDAD